jgi:hypothetical protein
VFSVSKFVFCFQDIECPAFYFYLTCCYYIKQSFSFTKSFHTGWVVISKPTKSGTTRKLALGPHIADGDANILRGSIDCTRLTRSLRGSTLGTRAAEHNLLTGENFIEFVKFSTAYIFLKIGWNFKFGGGGSIWMKHWCWLMSYDIKTNLNDIKIENNLVLALVCHFYFYALLK